VSITIFFKAEGSRALPARAKRASCVLARVFFARFSRFARFSPMFATLFSAAPQGVEAEPVRVEVNSGEVVLVSAGLPGGDRRGQNVVD
jgi:hypothetical protein